MKRESVTVKKANMLLDILIGLTLLAMILTMVSNSNWSILSKSYSKFTRIELQTTATKIIQEVFTNKNILTINKTPATELDFIQLGGLLESVTQGDISKSFLLSGKIVEYNTTILDGFDQAIKVQVIPEVKPNTKIEYILTLRSADSDGKFLTADDTCVVIYALGDGYKISGDVVIETVFRGEKVE